MDLVIDAIENNQHINNLIPEESPMTLKIKNIIGKFKEKLNLNLNDNNIIEKVKSEVFKICHSRIEQHLEILQRSEKAFIEERITLKTIKTNIKLWKTNSKCVIQEITRNAIKLSSNFLDEISKEEGPMILEIKSLLGKFKDKLNDNLTDSNINEKIKIDVCKMYRSKYDKHLEKVKIVKDSLKRTEHNFQQFGHYRENEFCKFRKMIDDCKLESDNLIEEIVNKAIEFSYQTGQVQPVVNMIPNQQNNLIMEESEMDSVIDNSLSIITTHSMILNQSSHIVNPIIANEESEAMLKIKSLLVGFEKKLNDSLNDNSNIINEKIKSAIYKIYHPKCKKHLEKLELIEKSIEKYEDLPNSQKTEKIINHLDQIYKQIEKWELNSDDLIETITLKALELSCKTQPEVDQQNNLSTQTLLNQMAELNKNIVKMNQNHMELLLPIEQVYHEGSSNFLVINPLDDSKFEKSRSVYSDGSYGIVKGSSKKEKIKEAVKIEKKRGDIKGEIKHIKLGINKHWLEDEIKEDLKYTLDKLQKIIDYFKTHDDQLNGKNNESIIIEELGRVFEEGFNEW